MPNATFDPRKMPPNPAQLLANKMKAERVAQALGQAGQTEVMQEYVKNIHRVQSP